MQSSNKESGKPTEGIVPSDENSVAFSHKDSEEFTVQMVNLSFVVGAQSAIVYRARLGKLRLFAVSLLSSGLTAFIGLLIFVFAEQSGESSRVIDFYSWSPMIGIVSIVLLLIFAMFWLEEF